MADPARRIDPAPPSPRAGGLAARASGNMSAPWLSSLNPEQRQAVEATEGPVLVLAGAGTGKTKVLTTRIAHILATGRAKPGQILAVTFTNKAAREMRERIGHLVGHSVEGMPWLGTFHSIGRKILSRHAEAAGLSPNFTVLDTDDQLRLLKQLLQAANIDEKRWTARALAGLIEGWKNRGLTPKQADPTEGGWFAGGKGHALYLAYQERLKVLNACDFGDLIVEPIRLFRERPDLLEEYRGRFRYMLVDEYQDTNVAQYLWLRLLAGERGKICCVGDDDQSIYGWRGAEVDNILRFEKDFPGATVVRLERNYRSTAHILAAASHLIAHNDGRLGKTLHPEIGEEGEKPTLTSAWDSEEEARLIGEEIEQAHRRQERLNDMAILVRASFQMREFEERFITLGLPYRVIGGPRFYERAEIRDAMAYLRCVANPTDDLAFERIVNVPKRGLGDATLQTVHAYARAKGVSLMQAARDLAETEEMKPKPRQTLRDLVASFARWKGESERVRHTDLAELVLDESGYTEMWKQERSADAQGRLDNLKELVRAMDEFDTLAGFLEHVSLVMDADKAENEDAVSIMTIHSAKGLEFDTVFLPGLEEGLFPHQRALDENGRAGLEEERRLAYVALTRAKRRLHLYFAKNRRIHGLWSSSIPSRFVDELPESSIAVKEGPSTTGYGAYNSYSGARFEGGRHDPFAGTYSTPGWQRAIANKGRVGDGRSAFSPGPAERGRGGSAAGGGGLVIEGRVIAKSIDAGSGFSVGQRVFHQKFGYGEISELDGNKATVQFEKAGAKRVLDSFLERA